MSNVKRLYEIIIVGGGPAALTAAIYTSRANLSTLLFEGEQSYGDAKTEALVVGGQLMTTTEVENFSGFPKGGISGPDLVMNMAEQAKEFGAKIVGETVLAIDHEILCVGPRKYAEHFMVKTRKGLYTSRSLILATGATAKYIGLKSEKVYMNRGVSACATCDGALPRFRNKALVVVGGGDTAMEEATFLSRFANRVFIVHRRDTFRASRIMSDRVLKNEKITVLWNSVVTDLKGNEEEGLQSVCVKNIKDDSIKELECAGYFCAIGHKPNSDLVKHLVPIDENGYIIPSKPGSCQTKIDGLFVCGDVCDKVYRQAITAAASGCMAAIDATRWIEQQNSNAETNFQK